MTDMIERVAQAIFAKDPESLFTIHQARVYAIAAIAAMREPTEAMEAEGTEALYDRDQPEPLSAIVYRAMISEALQEKTP